jgi:hypothetical protein
MTKTAEDEERYVTDVEIVPAKRQANQCLASIHDRFITGGIPPGKQYVDQTSSVASISQTVSAGESICGGECEKGTRAKQQAVAYGISRSTSMGEKQATWRRRKRSSGSREIRPRIA